MIYSQYHANRYYFWYWWIWALSIFCLTLNLKNSALPGIFKRLLACLWKVKVQMLFQDKQQYSVAQANILNSLSQVLFEIVDILSFGSFENVHVCPKNQQNEYTWAYKPPTHRCSLWTSMNFSSSGTWQKMKVLQELKFQVPPIDMHITAFPSVTKNRKNEIRNWLNGTETDGTCKEG